MSKIKFFKMVFGMIAAVCFILIYGIIGGIENNAISISGALMIIVSLIFVCLFSLRMRKLLIIRMRKLNGTDNKNEHAEKIFMDNRKNIEYKKVS